MVSCIVCRGCSPFQSIWQACRRAPLWPLTQPSIRRRLEISCLLDNCQLLYSCVCPNMQEVLELRKCLDNKKIRLKGVKHNLIDQIWGSTQPVAPTAPVRLHPQVYAGTNGDGSGDLLSLSNLIFCSVKGQNVTEKISSIQQNILNVNSNEKEVCLVWLLCASSYSQCSCGPLLLLFPVIHVSSTEVCSCLDRAGRNRLGVQHPRRGHSVQPRGLCLRPRHCE